MNREKAARKIKEFGLYHAIQDLPNSAETVEAFKMAIEALKEEPRAKGHWESHKSCKHTCSVCGYHTFLLTHYCPNCGAKMKGEQ